MSQLLQNPQFFDDIQCQSTAVVFNGTAKAHIAFTTLEVDFNDNEIAVYSTNKGGFGSVALLLKSEVEQKKLEKLSSLTKEDIVVLNKKLKGLTNPAEVIEFTDTYIIFEYENSEEVILNELLNVLLEFGQ